MRKMEIGKSRRETKMREIKVAVFGLLFCLAIVTGCFADQVIVAKKVASAPVIDGLGDDPAWKEAVEYTTYDNVAKINMTLKAVYTDTEIFFLVSYPDADKSDTHKTWIWDKSKKMYKDGADREDVFVFKWNMEPKAVDLSLKADNDYKSDIWFWKACRTDPVGYADDKYDQYSSVQTKNATELTSRTGKKMYLVRNADSGTPSFEDVLYTDYQGDKMSRFKVKPPTGSSADIRAKGVWSEGKWVIEFARALNTGNKDDVQFDNSQSYLFGVSRYEIAGRAPDQEVSQPLYGSGDISEALTLQFGK